MASTGRRSKASPKSGATISDVARRAGVSTATVSRALSAPERVAAETRARVAAAVAATGYTPNAAARNLRARSTRIVLALMPGMSNTFFNPILNAIEETLSAAGYGMIIGDTRNSTAREAHYARLIRAGQVDGLILFTGHLPRGEDGSVDVGDLPIALICNEIPGDGDHSVFDVDNRLSASKAVGHLIAAGHRRIGFIGGPEGNIEAIEREHGYREALAAVGLSAEDRLMWPGNFQFEAGIEAAGRLLALDRRPTAVFASADESAIGLIRALRDGGVRTPEDISVVGFDDLDYASVIDPPLTTIHQPRADLGLAAAADLLGRMTGNGADMPPTRLRLPCRLVVRESVRQVRIERARA